MRGCAQAAWVAGKLPPALRLTGAGAHHLIAVDRRRLLRSTLTVQTPRQRDRIDSSLKVCLSWRPD